MGISLPPVSARPRRTCPDRTPREQRSSPCFLGNYGMPKNPDLTGRTSQNNIVDGSEDPPDMLQAFVITLREGLEAFLIVAISLSYLKKTGRRELVPAVHWAIGASILLSIGAGLLLAKARNQSLWEGILGIVAAFLVASLTVHMWRAGKRMKRDIEGETAIIPSQYPGNDDEMRRAADRKEFGNALDDAEDDDMEERHSRLG